MQKMLDSKIIIALDYSEKSQVKELCAKLDNKKCKLKIGKQIFTKYGPSIIEEVQSLGFGVFLDLKFHDIPETVYKACIEAFKLGVWMLNVHALGGAKMMESAVKARNEVNVDAKLIAVTLLTSLDRLEISQNLTDNRINVVKSLAAQAYSCKLDGIVCSPADIRNIDNDDTDFLYVTPGIRLETSSDDHHEVFTPKTAIDLGSSYFVIGRPITQAKDPMVVINKILSSI
tara:strand:+ start:1104 stop:1793 length:690 start_codon:yes stop_codon:yes gene_type:complete